MSGSTAAIASTMANLVAIWRILMSVMSHVRHPRRSPESKGIDNVALRFFVDIETRADGARALAPGQKDRGRIVDHGLLKRRGTRLVFVVIARRVDRIERRIDL